MIAMCIASEIFVTTVGMRKRPQIRRCGLIISLQVSDLILSDGQARF